MPELPEVETTLRGVTPHVVGRRVQSVVVRERRMRQPVPRTLDRELPGQRIVGAERRGKYLLLRAERGTVIIHLGMSGGLRVVPHDAKPRVHDHVDFVLDGGQSLRFKDPRRFGIVLWTKRDPLAHELLRDLGPEPLLPGFDGDHLHRASRRRSAAVKSFIMDASVVVGVGNIYASEALFRAGIHPHRPARRIAADRYRTLAAAIRAVLEDAIAAGGTTVRDFVDSHGEPGRFARQLAVYERAGEPCLRCSTTIRATRTGQRSTYFCPNCQR